MRCSESIRRLLASARPWLSLSSWERVCPKQALSKHRDLADMSVVATTDKTEVAKGWPIRRLRAALLVPGFVILGYVIYMLLPAPGSPIQGKGQLSAIDVDRIRQEVTRWRHRDLNYAISHLRVAMLWDQIRVRHTCPLVSIASYDGKTGFAICQGRTWAGNQISIVYMFTNTAGAWSGTTVTRSERK